MSVDGTAGVSDAGLRDDWEVLCEHFIELRRKIALQERFAELLVGSGQQPLHLLDQLPVSGENYGTGACVENNV